MDVCHFPCESTKSQTPAKQPQRRLLEPTKKRDMPHPKRQRRLGSRDSRRGNIRIRSNPHNQVGAYKLVRTIIQKVLSLLEVF